ncbi:pancreatic triacylglycerol lipase-like [Saccostrea echinata]|uniref:pancreatic triacylglycerol lipase-like n=1 Tax=Saccostrea echinata TaxID=191078 RepID=UPI002A8237D5|nr:pancreatic triacylglycerol lipase-like [Saccostrea echinata]
MWYGKFWWTYSALRLIFPDVCYKNDKIGCYNKEEPFAHFDILPNSPGKHGMNVNFKLYRRFDNEVPELLNGILLDEKRTSTHYDPGKKIVFLIHGFNDNGENAWILKMKENILQKEDINVVIVDWGKGAKHLNYMIAASNTRTVGAYLGRLISTMVPDLSMVHIIGHSLGAQIAGFAGAWTRGKIGHITGLDPAGPLFDKYHPKARLDANDASFVDVIHTDTGGAFNLGLGMNNHCGDIDFFPNGGEVQPGCNQSALRIADTLIKFRVEDAQRLFPCSHERSIQLYIESILSECKFLLCSCTKDAFFNELCTQDNCTHMGYDVDQRFRGEFYGYTQAHAPYCITEKTLISSSEDQGRLFNTTATPTELEILEALVNTTQSLNGNVTENTLTEQSGTIQSNLTIVDE